MATHAWLTDLLQLRFLTIQSKVSEITGDTTAYERDCLVRAAAGNGSRMDLAHPWNWFREGTGNWVSS